MRRSKIGFVALFIAVATAAVSIFVLWRPHSADLTIPAILQGKEPSVVARVEETLKAVSANPDEPELWRRLGYVYEANLLLALALESYHKSLSIDAAQPKAWYRAAKIKMSMGDRVGAIAAAQRVVELAPDFAPIRWRLGFWHLEQGHLEQAQTSFERAVTLDAEDPAGWWGLARVLLQNQQPQQAAAMLEGRLEKWPDDAYAHLLLGTAYRHLGRWQEARVALQRGAGGAPVWRRDAWDEEVIQYKAGLEVELGKVRRLFERGQLDKAIVMLEKLRRQYPDDLTVLSNLGTAYVEQRRPRQALEVCRTALRSHPEDVHLHFNLALAYIDLKNSTQALKHLDRVIALDPTMGEAYEKKGTMLANMGQYGAAADVFEQALQYDPHNPLRLLPLGLVQCELEQWDAGLANLQRAVALDSTLTQAFVGIGIANQKLGALDEAEAAFERAAALNPAYPRIKILLEKVRQLKTRKGDL